MLRRGLFPMKAQASLRQRSVRCGAASLEVVLTTAVVLPLAALMFFLGVKICQYVFRGVDGMMTLPWL